MKIERIEDARAKILDNARELVEEAELLLNNKRYARAYTLSHLACEEMAKIPIIVRAATDELRGLDVDWKKVHRRIRSHKEKIKGFLFTDFIIDDDTDEDADIKRLFENLDQIGDYDKFKNFSLYTTLIDDKYVKPSELINKDLASESVKLARDRFIFYENFEKKTQGKLKTLVELPEFEEICKKRVDPLRKEKKYV